MMWALYFFAALGVCFMVVIVLATVRAFRSMRRSDSVKVKVNENCHAVLKKGI